MMNTDNYISLAEYAHRYKISIEDLRNKIRLRQVKFIFSNSEYRIKDEPVGDQHLSGYRGENKIVEDQGEHIEYLSSQLEKTKLELNQLKSNYEDLKNLIKFLEKENAEMQETILGIRKIDQWLAKQNKTLD